jgi:curved DNA-binding protein CbpA
VTLDEALALLGLTSGADAAAVKGAYRAAARNLHPDLPGAPPDANERMTHLNDAYTALLDAVAAGWQSTAVPAGAAASTAGGAAASSPRRQSGGDAEPETTVQLDVDGSLLVEAPADETFALLAEAAELLGDVTYVDRASGLLQILVPPETGGGNGAGAYLTFSLQGRALGTEVFVTIESIDAAPPVPLRPLLELLAELIAQSSA